MKSSKPRGKASKLHKPDNSQTSAAVRQKAAAHPTARDAAVRREEIAREAYFRAERRGFAPGYELEDWLAAEAAVDGQTQPRACINDPVGMEETLTSGGPLP